MVDNSEIPEAQVAHKHLFTPRDWCMIPYCARYGLTKDKVKSEPLLESMIMDQYARDCGFTPGDSWILIVRPSGECEFTPLGPNDPHWCCEKEHEIASKITRATVSTPPYE
jgi:hypothetical protein